jgi:hypothetical protein
MQKTTMRLTSRGWGGGGGGCTGTSCENEARRAERVFGINEVLRRRKINAAMMTTTMMIEEDTRAEERKAVG